MNLFEVAAALTLNTKAYKKGLDDAKRETKGFASSVSGSVGGASDSAAKLGQSFVSASRNGSSSVGILQKSVHALGSGVKAVVDGLLKIGEIGVKAFGAVSVAAVGVVKQAVSSYAEYEQLAGGIQKLYGEGAETVLKNAEKAYATTGMSANEYLQNATSFSAMLVNSLAGDEKKAAEMTDTAMRDIADNANTFGKWSASELANVYQSLARGEYRLLDNLQLGFGGTKEEAQRLINTANKLKQSMGQVGDLALGNFADMVEALHLISEEMGISGLSAEEAAEKVAAGLMTEEQAYQAMGTTAKEATKTISGSLTMTKKAVQDFVAGLANPNADIERLVNNVVTSAGYAAENLIPTIERAVSGLTTSLEKLAPRTEKIAEQFGGMAIDVATSIAGAMPSLIDAGSKLIIGLLNGIDKNRTKITEAAKKAVSVLTKGFAKNSGTLIKVASSLIADFIKELGKNANELATAGRKVVESIAGAIRDNIGTLLPAAVDTILDFAAALLSPESIGALADSAAELLVALGGALGDSVHIIIEKAPAILNGLATGLAQNFDKIVQAGVDAVGSFLSGLLSGFSGDEGENLIGAIANVILSIFTVPVLGMDFKSLAENFLQGLKTGFEQGDWSIFDGIFEARAKKVLTRTIMSVVSWRHWFGGDEDDNEPETVEPRHGRSRTSSGGDALPVTTGDQIGGGITQWAQQAQYFNKLDEIKAQLAEGKISQDQAAAAMDELRLAYMGAAERQETLLDIVNKNLESGNLNEDEASKIREDINSGVITKLEDLKNANDSVVAKLDEAKKDGTFGGTTADGQPLELTGIKVDAEDLAAAMGNVIVKTASDETVTSLNDTITTINDNLGKFFPELSTGITTGNESLTSVIGLMQQYLPYIPQLAALKVVLDSGALVGALTPMVNAALGAQLGVEQRGGA